MVPDAQLVVVVNLPGGAAETRHFNGIHKPIQIGSARTCQVCIPLPKVYPFHAEVVVRNSSLYLEDRSSGNTFVDRNGPITRLHLPYMQRVSVALNRTDVTIDLTSGIEDGGHLLPEDKVRVVRLPQSLRQLRPLEESLPEERGPGGRIEATLLAQGYREEFTLTGDKAATIGRTHTCQIRVPDDVEGVSRAHARLSWNNGWLVLDDLDSTNGTWINDQRIKRVVLRPPAHHHIDLGQPGASLSVRVVPFREEPRSSTETRAILALKENAARMSNAREQALAQVRQRASSANESSSPEQARRAPDIATDLVDQQRRHLEQQRQMLSELERRRIEAEGEWEHEWRRIDEERRSLQQERRVFEEERQRSQFSDAGDTDPTLTAFVEDDVDLQWLTALPEPDRDVFRHLATHGQVNEEEATRILGGPRQFRQFSMRFETHLAHCPFKVRIETGAKVKCYVRDD